MKTLKKVLSVVLALAMVLSMTAIASAKTDFSDDAKITDREAIEVMNKIGVFIGSNGAVNPTGTLSRAEAAKLVTYLDLGATAAESLPAVAVFSDVKATDWEAKYVAYLKDAGYVAGVGANKFNPDGNVTGYEFAKMLLGCLGYDADAEKMIGTTWQIAISKLMRDTEIGKKANYVGSKALTREEAARFCLEALKATMVEYDFTGATITVNGAVVKTGAAAADKVTANDKTNGTIAKDGYMQLGEKLYSKLVLTKDVDDEFGRPAHTWKYDKKEVGTYEDAATLVYTGKVAQKELYSAIGKTAVKEYDWTYYEDGTEVKASELINIPALSSTSTTKTLWNTDVEIFIDKDAETGRVVVMNTYFGEVSAVDKDEDGTETITVKDVQCTSGLDDREFEVKGFAKEDYVAFKVATNEDGDKYIESVYAPEKVNGTVKAINQKADSESNYVRIDSTDYNYGANINAVVGTTAIGDEYDVYLDANGYAIGFEAVKVATNYAYLADTAEYLGKHEAKLVFADGTVKTVEYNATKSKDITDPNGTGYLVTYTKTSKDVYTLTKFNSGDAYGSTSNYVAAPGTPSTTETIKNERAAFDSKLLDLDTIFVDVRDLDNVKVYTGYEEVPTYVGANTMYACKVVNGTAKKNVEVVFITAANKVENEDVVYFYVANEKDYITAEDDNETQYAERVIYVDGVKKTVNFDATENAEIDAKGLYKYDATDADGYAINVAKVTTPAVETLESVGTKSFYLKNTGAYSFDEDTVFVVVDATGTTTTVKAGSIASLIINDGLVAGEKYTDVQVVDNDGTYAELVYAYVVKKSATAYKLYFANEANASLVNAKIAPSAGATALTYGAEVLTEGKEYKFVVTPDTGYAVKKVQYVDFDVPADDKPTEAKTLAAVDGVYTIPASAVDEDLAILVEAVPTVFSVEKWNEFKTTAPAGTYADNNVTGSHPCVIAIVFGEKLTGAHIELEVNGEKFTGTTNGNVEWPHTYSNDGGYGTMFNTHPSETGWKDATIKYSVVSAEGEILQTGEFTVSGEQGLIKIVK